MSVSISISITNPETERAIRELAALTGESLTDAVTIAVRERLERLRQDSMTRSERIMEIVKITAPLLKGLPDHGDLLYDETTGLPK